jgi:hypothetical protein
MGVSTDNSTSVCEVYMILNEIKPYQRVNPTGNNVIGNRDYSLIASTASSTGIVTDTGVPA